MRAEDQGHAPGPWKVSGDGPWFVRNDAGLVAEFIDDPQTARLIAAAPDLLKFVKRFANAPHDNFCGAHPMMNDGPCACYVQSAQTLVAKTRGKS